MDCVQTRSNGDTGADTGAGTVSSIPALGAVPGIGARDSISRLQNGVAEDGTDVGVSAKADADGGGANVVAAVGMGSGAAAVGAVANIGDGDNDAGVRKRSTADDEIGFGAAGAAGAGATSTPVARDDAGVGANGSHLGPDAGGCNSKFLTPPVPKLMVSTCRKSDFRPTKMICLAQNAHCHPYSRSSPRDYSWRGIRN